LAQLHVPLVCDTLSTRSAFTAVMRSKWRPLLAISEIFLLGTGAAGMRSRAGAERNWHQRSDASVAAHGAGVAAVALGAGSGRGAADSLRQNSASRGSNASDTGSAAAAAVANGSLLDQARPPMCPQEEASGRRRCSSECRCQWYQHCFPHAGGKQLGICDISVEVHVMSSLLVFTLMLVLMMTIKTYLQNQADEKELEEAIERMRQEQDKMTIRT